MKPNITILAKVAEALFDARESAKKLAELGGSEPGLKPVPRRRGRNSNGQAR